MKQSKTQRYESAVERNLENAQTDPRLVERWQYRATDQPNSPKIKFNQAKMILGIRKNDNRYDDQVAGLLNME